MTFSTAFAVPIIPKGKPRHRSMVRGGRVITHPDPAGQRWEQQFALYAEQYAPPSPLEGPVQVDITAVFPRPKRLLRKKDPDGWLWHSSRPDLDNLWKAVLDALKTWFHDDAQVCLGRTGKVYGGKEERPSLKVVVREIVATPADNRDDPRGADLRRELAQLTEDFTRMGRDFDEARERITALEVEEEVLEEVIRDMEKWQKGAVVALEHGRSIAISHGLSESQAMFTAHIRAAEAAWALNDEERE